MVKLQKVKCKKCNAQYIIGCIELDKRDEYCPNCGEQLGLVVVSDDYKNTASSGHKIHNN